MTNAKPGDLMPRSFWVVEQFLDGKSQGYWDGGNSRSFVSDIDNAIQFCRRSDCFWATRGWHWTDVKLTEHVILLEQSSPVQDDEVRLAIHEAIGEATMCWDPLPTGVFASAKASRIAGRLSRYVRAAEQRVAPLDPDMPTQELRLHMGELTADQVLVARAAIRWANTRRVAPQTGVTEALDRLIEKIPFDPDNEMVPRAVGLEQSFRDYMQVKAVLTAHSEGSEALRILIELMGAIDDECGVRKYVGKDTEELQSGNAYKSASDLITAHSEGV